MTVEGPEGQMVRVVRMEVGEEMGAMVVSLEGSADVAAQAMQLVARLETRRVVASKDDSHRQN